MTRLGLALAALALAVLAPAPAGAQMFFASRPHPVFMVGPLFISAVVGHGTGDVPVDVLFNLSVPPGRSAGEVGEDVYFLWPGAVAGEPALGPPDPALARYIEARGLAVTGEGRLALFERDLYARERDQRDRPVAGGAPFVTFVRDNATMGLSQPATWVRVPWNARLLNRAWLMDFRFTPRGLVKPRKSGWLEETFRGRRHSVALSFNDMRSRALFPMYLEHRDRMIHLAEDPSQIFLNFPDADHLKIDEVFPQSASRRRSETRESTETVSLFLNSSAGTAPQTLSVQYGYFSNLQSWGTVLVPLIFFALGNIVGPWAAGLAKRIGRYVAARIHVGRPDVSPSRESGVVLSRETLAGLVPGQTTYDEVVRRCGPDADELERSASPGHRTLVYRGQRLVPRRRRTFGWLATVDRWDLERHEVEIELEGDVVADVQARLRRTRLPGPGESA
ncbi:MAG: hypothetical protein HY216_11465 [Candidatus Rokubacteria bacterium]|nr:hypothetical protein [Candidatus Rokubacteria bacterium]